MSSVVNPKRLIVLLAALVAFGPLSIDMYLPGLPLIAQDLQAPESSIQLTISAFLAGLFVGMLFYGPLSDKYGRRLLLGGIILYLTASIGCCGTGCCLSVWPWRARQLSNQRPARRYGLTNGVNYRSYRLRFSGCTGANAPACNLT